MSELPKNLLEEEFDTTRKDWVVNSIKRTHKEIRACYAKKLEEKAKEIEKMNFAEKTAGDRIEQLEKENRNMSENLERRLKRGEELESEAGKVTDLEATIGFLEKEISCLRQTIFDLQKRGMNPGSGFRHASAETAADAPVIVHKWESGERPIGLKLTKTTKGYTWEISMKGTEVEELMCATEKVDRLLRFKYGEQETVATPGGTSPPKS